MMVFKNLKKEYVNKMGCVNETLKKKKGNPREEHW